MSATTIEWTDQTWNPVVGCDRISPGCDHCYAIGVAHRAMQPAHIGLTIRREGDRPDWSGVVRCLPERLDQPLSWVKPRRVFVNSMSDLFHPDVPDKFIADVFDVMACHGPIARHTFQVLTKRPQRMAKLLNEWAESEGYVGASNVWLGTSIENARYAFRADHLRETPAAVRFLSIEPLLGPVGAGLDLLAWLENIDWVIVGGESGPGARPMHPDWVRPIRDACQFLEIPFFFKQWGAWRPIVGGLSGAGFSVPDPYERCELVGKKIAGRVLDGRTWDEYPT